MKNLHEKALRDMGEVLGDRLRSAQRGRASNGALASALPVSAEEVTILARIAGRHSVPLVALGAGTGFEARAEQGGVLVRFDLMRGLHLPDSGEPWAEPGALWLGLDNNLRIRGRGLAVYPTSAPRATIGGWLAQDGLGVGSFEYGWLRENVLAADVVLPGGERRMVPGEELGDVVGTGSGGIVVGAKLRTRRADGDAPFGAGFEDPNGLVGAVADLHEAGVPLWHLGFTSPAMSRARGLGESYLLFGAYPRERAAAVEKVVGDAFGSRGGQVLPAAEAYRVWGERFFPIAPSKPAPAVERALVPLADLAEALSGAQVLPEEAVQGTVAGSGEVFLLTLKT